MGLSPRTTRIDAFIHGLCKNEKNCVAVMQTFVVSLEFTRPSEKQALSFLIEMFRRSKNLSRSQLEELAFLPDRSLDRIEKGTREVDILELQRIASALDRPIDDFLPRQVKNEQNNVGDRLARSVGKG